MAGFNTGSDQHLTRSNIWSRELKDVLLDELFATKYIRMVKD